MSKIFTEFIITSDVNVSLQFTTFHDFPGVLAANSANEEDLFRRPHGDSCMAIPLLAEKGFDMRR